MKFVTLFCLFTLLPATAMAGPLDVNGLWQTPSGNAHVEIADCGDGTPCGTLKWIDFKPGDSGLDERNPDQALRQQPLIGLLMLSEFKRGGSSWKAGKIYDPEEGKSYRSNLKLKEDGTLQVKGCIGPLCQSQIWARTELAED